MADDKARSRTAARVGIGSLAALYLGDRWGALAEGSRDPLSALSSTDPLELAAAIVSDPLAVSASTFALLCGLALFCLVWGAYAYVIGGRANVRYGDEYGTARRGTVREGQAYRDMRHPDNNIILTKNLGIAIRKTEGVRQQITARNVCVLGGTGSNKTTGLVMPNILQLGADRDMVVVDPKGTTLATCGHALVAAGIDVTVFNSVDMQMSDAYNPLANIRDYGEVIDFVTCLIENTNNGRESSDPIWDNGEALFYRALITLLLDWFPREDLTMKNVVMLANMADIADEGEGSRRSPLDLIFDQIETGVKWVPAEGRAHAGAGGAFDPSGPAEDGRLVSVPSRFRRRDGVVPATRERPGGGRGLAPDEDEALSVWHQFRHGAGKTLKSFVISSHTRLAYLSTPDVLRLLAGDDGTDRIHLERLGQVEDEWGRPLPPRVVFVISSDFNGNLNSLLSIMMWQAIYLPMSAADTRNEGRLPRPVSLVFDEFRNIGKLGSFIQTIAVVRSRNIDVTIMLQSASQLEEVYGKEGAATIRGNCATTVYLGGARDTGTAKAISEEIGKETVYKYDWSRQGQGIGASQTRQRSSLGRDVYDANEVATLPAGRALVLIGDKQVIEDDKSFVWEHPNYDPTYMGLEPERQFDYRAWRDAGKPFGDDLSRWEEAFFGEELPARRASERISRQLELARHEAETSVDPRAREEAGAHARFLAAHAETCRLRHGLARMRSHAAAGLAVAGIGDAEAELEAAERAEADVEREIRAAFGAATALAATEFFE